MKILFIAGLLLVLPFNLAAQENTFEQDVTKLVRMSVDTGTKAMMRNALGFRLTAEEKEQIIKDYDTVVYDFLAEIEKYYLAEFTHDEVKQMISFYESPVGKKFLRDNKKIVENDIPPAKEWTEQVSGIRKKDKEQKETEE